MAASVFQIVIPIALSSTGRIGYGKIPAPGGFITDVDAYYKIAQINSGDTTLDVHLNGASVFALEADRPTIAQGETGANATGLNVACTKGQDLDVFLDAVPIGGTNADFVVMVTIETGETGGAAVALPDGDLSEGNFLEFFQGRDIVLPSPVFFEDDFDDDALDPLKWEFDLETGATGEETGGQLELTPSAPATYATTYSLAFWDLTGRTISFDVKSVMDAPHENVVTIQNQNSDFIQIKIIGGDVLVRRTVGAVLTSETFPFSLAEISAFKIKNTPSDFCEVYAKTAAGWELLTSFASTGVFANSNFLIDANNVGADATPGTFAIDNFKTNYIVSDALADGVLFKWNALLKTFEFVAGALVAIDGGGTANKLAKFSDADTIADSSISDDGTNITLNDKTFSRFTAKRSTQTGTTYTLVAADNGSEILFTNAASITLTIPTGLVVGFNVLIRQEGAGVVTVSPAGGVTLHNRQSHTKTAGLYAAASLESIALNDYRLQGDTAT